MEKQKTKFKQTEIGMIPEDWTLGKLKDYLTLLKDGSHNPPKRVNKGIKFIAGASDIKYRNIDFTNCTYITEEDYKKIHKFYELKENDVLLTIVGTVGNAAIVRKNNLPFSLQRSIAVLRCAPSLDSEYLFYWLTSKRFKQILYANINPTGQPGIYLGTLGDLSIPIPIKPEQQRIAKILSDLDSKIELNQQMNKTLEAIGQAIFKHWFVDFEFPNEEGKPYKSSGGEMVDSELGKIPRGWKVSRIGDELSTVLGGTPSTTNKEYWENGNIPWINSGKINEFRIIEPTALITESAVNNSATKLLPKGTTVLAITGATLGQVSRIEIDTCANQSVVGIIESEKLQSEYIYFWIKNNIKKIISSQTGGAQQHINKNNINMFEILIPSGNTMNAFNKIIKPIFNQIARSCFESKNLSQIRDSLLPKLMSGKIRVPIEVKHG
ncbi:MAG: restriction endonuclease subunit S [Candidatus Woesearchaeota archaeon]